MLGIETAPPRLLVVDDDMAFCELVETWLDGSYDLGFAHDGEAGVREARRERPDLILLDVMMPKLSGFSLAWVFKNDPLFRGVPVIYCTAHASDWPNPEASLSKADAYILKPFSLEDLRSMLAAQLAPLGQAAAALLGEGDPARHGPLVETSEPATLNGDQPWTGQVTRLTLWGALFEVEAKASLDLGRAARLSSRAPDGSPLELGCRVVGRRDARAFAVRFHFSTPAEEESCRRLFPRTI